MAKKSLTVTQIKMYETMVTSDFMELMSRVRQYRAAIKEQALIEVSKEKGLFDLKMLQKKLELQLSEVKEKITRIAGGRYAQNPDFEEAVKLKANDLLGHIGNGSLADIEATYEHFLRKVRLAGVTDDVREVFEKDLPSRIAELTEAVKALPPIPKSDADATKLLED